MKTIIIICLVFSSRILSQSYPNNLNDSLIVWNENRKLEWKDFKEKNNNAKHFKGHIAESAVSIKYNMTKFTEDQLSNLNVVACFHKKNSWTTVKYKETLAHEQLHFDIVEVYARKIRKEFLLLKEKQIEDYREYINVYHRYNDEMRKCQMLFDNETISWYVRKKTIGSTENYELIHEDDTDKENLEMHSFGFKPWQEKIAKELKELDDYNYTFDINDFEE